MEKKYKYCGVEVNEREAKIIECLNATKMSLEDDLAIWHDDKDEGEPCEEAKQQHAIDNALWCYIDGLQKIAFPEIYGEYVPYYKKHRDPDF